jgi:hypothetical protein
MAIDYVLEQILNLWQLAKSNYEVVIPILVYISYIWTKSEDNWLSAADKYIFNFSNKLEAEDYTKALLGHILRYLGAILEGLRSILAALIAILVFLLLSALK